MILAYVAPFLVAVAAWAWFMREMCRPGARRVLEPTPLEVMVSLTAAARPAILALREFEARMRGVQQALAAADRSFSAT